MAMRRVGLVVAVCLVSCTVETHGFSPSGDAHETSAPDGAVQLGDLAQAHDAGPRAALDTMKGGPLPALGMGVSGGPAEARDAGRTGRNAMKDGLLPASGTGGEGGSAPETTPSEAPDDMLGASATGVDDVEQRSGTEGGQPAVESSEPSPQPQPGDGLPALLAGTWYAGSGYTSAPYDPTTGAWGTPTGKGLVYTFAADGTYQKAFQSYASDGGCTTGFTAFENGSVQADETRLTLVPVSGHLKYTDNCAPSLDSDKPTTDLSAESFSWQRTGTDLVLVRSDGASSTFRALD